MSVHLLKTYEITANGATDPFEVEPYKAVTLVVSTPALTGATLKLSHSISEDMPDFSATANDTNRWDYLSSIDMDDTSSIVTGTTGFTLSGESCTNIVVATDTSRWFGIVTSGYTGGKVIVELITTD
jgi:hypothetical protein